MILRELPDGIPDLLPMQGRSPGTHVSDIIRYLCIKLRHFDDEGDAEPPITRWQFGAALERAIGNRFAEHFPDRYVGVGELELDGLHGTPDLVDLQDWAVEEIKLTWMSSRHETNSKKFWKYWVQLKSYCWMLETGLGRLSVGFVNGNYVFGTPEANPTYKRWEAEFTKKELQENWNMLLKNRDAAERWMRAREERRANERR